MIYQRGKKLLSQDRVSWESLKKTQRRKFYQIRWLHTGASFVTYTKSYCKISYQLKISQKQALPMERSSAECFLDMIMIIISEDW